MSGRCSMRCKVVIVMMTLACGHAAAAQGPTYNLGRPPTDEELFRPDAVIGPDGDGLPPGSGTAAEGEMLYVARGCGACHGPTGTEGPGPRLAGPHEGGTRGTGRYDALYGIGSRLGYRGNWQGRGIRNFPFAPVIWSQINSSMPLNQAGFLTADEVYSLTAYLLYVNEIIEEDLVLDATSLPQVQMPNRDRFVYTPDHPAFSEWTPRMPRTRVR